MSEKPEEKKKIEAVNKVPTEGEHKEEPTLEEKHKVLHLDIDLDELFSCVPDFKLPEDIWASKADMSKEYIEMSQRLQLLMVYITRNINEGPEVKDNISKRVVLVRTLLGAFLDNLAITGYDTYGILTELVQEIYMKLSGKRHILQTLAQLAQADAEGRKNQSQSYVS